MAEADTDPGNTELQTAQPVSWPSRRVIVLGASNVARGLPIVLESARRAWGAPLDVLAAIGHGRSFGMTSRVLGRELPGILQCGLWDAWRERPSVPTAALITDIGNDILFGASAEQIGRWVETCLERLRPHVEQIVVTNLPLHSVTRLSPRRFALLRTLLFPKSRIQLDDALHTARRVAEQVVDLAARYEVALAQPAEHWYGFDPIHVLRRHQPQAWQSILSRWCEDQAQQCAAHEWRRAWELRGLRPQVRRMFGIEQRRAQPSKRLADGSLISLY